MLRSLVFLSLIGVPLMSSAQALDHAELDSEFRRLLGEADVPGGAYAIVKDGRIVHAVGYGVRKLGQDAPVTADTVFRTASVSKTFAAQLTAILVDEGKLHWDDNITQFVPEFQLKRAGQAQRLQLQNLLGQSTGIVRNAYDNLLDANVPLARIMPQFRELEPVCQTGRCYSYQNILFALIAPAIEQATQRSYASLVQERLFVPLGMSHASIGMADFLATENKALPHIKKDGAWQTAEVESGYYQILPAAGVNASVNDLGEWLIAQMGYRPDIVAPKLVDGLTRKRVRTAPDLRRRGWRDLLTDAHYGLGWRIYTIGDEEIIMHSGWVKGFVSDIGYSRSQRTGLVVLLNAESGVINEFTTLFWKRTLSLQEFAKAQDQPVIQDDRRQPAPIRSGAAASASMRR
jgi:beta-lactamase class C